jgi:hypothetical protein
MSWDIFVQDLPEDASTVQEIPDDFQPKPLMSRVALLSGIKEVIPQADVTDPSWIRVDGPGYSIEINVGRDDPVLDFAFHVRGGDLASGVIAHVLEHFDLRAIDPGSDTGMFDRDGAADSLRKWRAYRDQVAGDRSHVS